MDWSDEGLDRRRRRGVAGTRRGRQEELPAPRIVEIAPADVIFQDGLEIDRGRVTVTVRHLGGDHRGESSVMYVEPDRVLFLGDCMYRSRPASCTVKRAIRTSTLPSRLRLRSPVAVNTTRTA
jgi:glyoxylase-like metal-dependent hydrolase (beta-lactamase superfamily II)